MELLQWFINFLIKELLVVVLKMKMFVIQNYRRNYPNQLLKTSKKRKVNLPFIDNIWVEDLAYMQLISKFNKLIRFLLCVVDIYKKYAWNIPAKDKNGITITNAFKKI